MTIRTSHNNSSESCLTTFREFKQYENTVAIWDSVFDLFLFPSLFPLCSIYPIYLPVPLSLFLYYQVIIKKITLEVNNY